MSICLLSTTEAARLENWAVWPRCKHHHHLKRHEVDRLIAEEAVRYVGGNDTRVQCQLSMVVATDDTRTWRNKPSGGPLGMVVRQLVRSV